MEKQELKRIKQLLEFSPDTGLFIWKQKTGSVAGGVIAGTPHKGYVRIQVDGALYRAHRLAWEWFYGAKPIGEIDHINGDKSDNRIGNLRCVDHSTNMQNQSRAHAVNSCKTLGVSEQGGRYRARLRVNGKNASLGMYDTLDAAHQAYVAAKRVLHTGCAI